MLQSVANILSRNKWPTEVTEPFMYTFEPMAV